MYQNTRLTKHWLLLDFMLDPSVYGCGYPLPYAQFVTEEVIEHGRFLCADLIEPLMERFGQASVSAGWRVDGLGAKGPHEWTKQTGVAGDFIFHDWVNQERAPIKFAEELMHAGIPFERIITYAGSEVVCLSVKEFHPRHAIMENVKSETPGGRPKFTIHAHRKSEWRWLNGQLPDRPDWRRGPNETMWHAKGRIRPQHVRVGRYFTLLDFCRSEEGIEQGIPWVVEPTVSQKQVHYARMFAEILDPVAEAVGKLTVVDGVVPQKLSLVLKDGFAYRWVRGPAKLRFLLPQGVEHDEPVRLIQEHPAAKVIEVDDHPSDAVVIELTIEPFQPRTFYSAGMPFGYHSGVIPAHLPQRVQARLRAQQERAA